MAQPYLNSAIITDAYTAATTVVFTQPRDEFQAQVSNKAVVYQLATPDPATRSPMWEPGEHDLVPSLTVFGPNDAAALGANKLAGVRFRNKLAGSPATVSVG